MHTQTPVSMTYSIAVVTCYFGQFPWYFAYFLHTCKFNPTVDFIIITDQKKTFPNVPKNVIFIERTLEDVVRIATKKLGFKVSIPYAYKLCDIKPAYGYLFSDLLKSYDFWGHGDIDIVYGNIRKFMTSKTLEEYDVISTRHDYITGTFALFRNNRQMNTLFMQSKDYKKVFSSSKHFCFDECNFLWKELQAGKSIYALPYKIESMTHIVRKFHDQGKLKALFDFIIVEGTPGRIKWVKGRIIYRNRFEAMFYHLIGFKVRCQHPIVFQKMPLTIHFSESKIYK